MKFSVIGLPHYTIWHLYEPSVDDLRHMEEMEAERLAHEQEQEQAEQKESSQTEPLGTDHTVDGEKLQGSEEGPAAEPLKDAQDSIPRYSNEQADESGPAEKVREVNQAKQ